MDRIGLLWPAIIAIGGARLCRAQRDHHPEYFPTSGSISAAPAMRRRFGVWCEALHFALAVASPSTRVRPLGAELEKTNVLAAGWFGCVVPGGVRQRNARPAAVPLRGRRPHAPS